MKKKSFFWVGYADLLTSLFFVMLVLFVVTFAILKEKNNRLISQNIQLELIKEVEKALGSLDHKYFEYDQVNKRYKLKQDISFRSGSDDFNDLSEDEKAYLEEAGRELFSTIKDLIKENPNIEYLLIVEGNTQRAVFNGQWNYESIPDVGYELSYRRALALVNFWKIDRNIPFNEIEDNCELLIAGSGYFGQSRQTEEELNRRFSIQVTSKVGKFLNKGQ